ncbi:MAG: bifunctional riboflavin kinase/FAD synthetase [Candidatus Omnitrophica bacterium]|nr:bifunctional riboflavin kinase/FAD synthetase [Candidatus Omnitrophota bacterium]
MKIYQGFRDKRLKKRPRAVAIGIFDGVHRGHRKIIQKALGAARRSRAASLVVTFEPHPNKILRPGQKHPILMSLEHRLRLFERLGIAEVLVIRFDRRFSKITHEDFLRGLLLKRLGMKSLCVGHDFRFGFRGRGDARYLRQESGKRGFGFSLVAPLKVRGRTISSTRIRRLIERGHLRKAEEMLGRPVSVYGTVIHGRGRGRSVGFPTANLNPHHETLPPRGVYAARGFLGERELAGVIHIGKRPTFADRQASLEVHFLNFHKNIYGREVELIFIKKLRPIRKFRDKAALAEAIREDIRKAAISLYKAPFTDYN